jgi:hypothetical protein
MYSDGLNLKLRLRGGCRGCDPAQESELPSRLLREWLDNTGDWDIVCLDVALPDQRG